MGLRNTATHYGSVAKGLHWLVALLIIGLLTVGLVMTGMALGPDKLTLYGWHKSFGITVLALVIVRLAWRLANPVPALPDHMARIEKLAAHGTHYVLYAMLFFMPLTGWMMSSAAGFPVSVFGLFQMPDVIGANKETREVLSTLHEIGAWTLIALIAMHALAALFHHFHHKDDVLKRMLPCLCCCVALFVSYAAAAREITTFTAIPEKSAIKFIATVNKSPSEGAFKSFTINALRFDPAHLDASFVKVTVDMLSVSSAYEEIATNLKTSDWFGAALFPQAVLETTAFRHLGGKRYEADAKLTIRAHTEPVTLTFTLDRYEAKSAVVNGSAVILRKPFGVGQGEWQETGTVADAVTIMFHVEAAAKE